MISCIKKHLFGISLSIAAIAIVFGVYCFYGKAILHDYEETQICHKIDNALNECQQGEKAPQEDENDSQEDEKDPQENEKDSSAKILESQDKILEKARKLYDVQQKFKDFKFMLAVHQDRYDELNKEIRSYLISYYELPYKGKEIELADIDEYVKTVQNAIKDIDEKKKDVEKTIANLNSNISESLKQIDDINLIKTTLNKLEELLTEKSDAEASQEKSQMEISAEEPVIAAAEEGANSEVPVAKKENNDWQKEFILNEQKIDKDGNPVKDSNGNIVYTANENFVSIKNKLSQICDLYEKYNELTNKNVDTAFIDNFENCKSFKDSLEYIVSQKANEATTKKAADIFKEKIQKVKVADALKFLDNIKSLDRQYVEVIGNHIKESIKNEDIDKVLGFLKFKLHDKFVTIICDELKVRIENNYINSDSFTFESFDKLKKVCNQIKEPKVNLNNHPLCKFADEYIDWYKKLEKGSVFNLEIAEAETTFPDGIIIDKFTGFNCDFKRTDKITGTKSFKENFKNLEVKNSNKENFKNLEVKNSNFRQPLTISISYYLLDAKPSLKNVYMNWGFKHTTSTAEKDIYPMLKSKWELKPQLKSGNNGPYATTFTLVIKNDSNYPTLEELFNNVFQKEKKSAKK